MRRCTAGARCPMAPKSCLVGADNFSFPIPLKKNDKGQWFFDTAAGKDEILARRVGRNELAVIDVCGSPWRMPRPSISPNRATVAARNNMR